MSWFTKLFSGGVGTVIEQVGNTIDKFHLSGEEKQQFRLELQQVLMKRESEIEQTLRKNLEAKERIIVAELQQGDNYTKRARPTVVYFGLLMIGLNYFLLPAALLITNNSDKLLNCPVVTEGIPVGEIYCKRETLFPLPDEFWMAWGGIVATWAVGRTFEKVGASNTLSRSVTGSAKKSSLFDDDDNNNAVG